MRCPLLIELLYVPGCPALEAVRQNLDLALAETQISAVLRETAVEDEFTAQALSFPGSTTIRVNGRDIQPATAQCVGTGRRVYSFRGQPTLVPPVQMLVEALCAPVALPKAS